MLHFRSSPTLVLSSWSTSINLYAQFHFNLHASNISSMTTRIDTDWGGTNYMIFDVLLFMLCSSWRRDRTYLCASLPIDGLLVKFYNLFNITSSASVYLHLFVMSSVSLSFKRKGSLLYSLYDERSLREHHHHHSWEITRQIHYQYHRRARTAWISVAIE